MGDAVLKHSISRKADRVLEALSFQELVNLRRGEGRIGAKVTPQAALAIASDDRLQNIPLAVSRVDVARAQRTALQVAEPVEHEKRVIARAAEMAIVG